MQITAERRVKLTQLIVHGDLFKYQAGGQMLAVLELAHALDGVDVPVINKVLLGGGLYQVAKTLLKGAIACELLVARGDKYHLTEYGQASLRECRAWAPLHTSVMAVGMLEGLAPGQTEDHPMHLVARLHAKDHLVKFTPIDPVQGDLSTPAARFIQRLDARAKWEALAEDGVPGSEGRSFDALLLRSAGSRMYSNSMSALVASEWQPARKGQPAQWKVKKVATLNQYPTPLKRLLDRLAGSLLPDVGERQVEPALAQAGFIPQPDGTFIYDREDALGRKVIDVGELTFEQRIDSEGWSLKVKGRLAAASAQQALQWYFAKVFKADVIATLDALRTDYGTYARRAGQPAAVTDKELRDAFSSWASSPNRAARSRRGFFLHFPR